MIKQTISRIEDKINNAPALKEESKAELLGLIGDLKEEISSLSKTSTERAESITGFVNISTHEAIRQDGDKNRRLLDLSIEGLASSVEDIEVTHPRLVQTVNSICNMLSNLGV